MTTKRFDFEGLDRLKIPKGMNVVSNLIPGGFFISLEDERFVVNRVFDAEGHTEPLVGDIASFKEALAVIYMMQGIILGES